MRKLADTAHQAGLCPETLGKVATLVRASADAYGEAARTRCREKGAATASYAAAEADAQSRALHELARTLEAMALRSTPEDTQGRAWLGRGRCMRRHRSRASHTPAAASADGGVGGSPTAPGGAR